MKYIGIAYHCYFQTKKQVEKNMAKNVKYMPPQNIGFFKGTQIPKLCHLPYFAFIYNIINMYFYFIILAFVCSHKKPNFEFLKH